MEPDISFLINNGVAIGVMWYVLIKLNSTLKDLTKVIENVSTRLKDIENHLQQNQLQLNDLKHQIDSLSRGDN